jgi:hypothetical protein
VADVAVEVAAVAVVAASADEDAVAAVEEGGMRSVPAVKQAARHGVEKYRHSSHQSVSHLPKRTF